MGISGLHRVIKQKKKVSRTHLSQFEGCTGAIDMMCYGWRSAYSTSLNQDEPTPEYEDAIRTFLQMFLDNNIKPVGVLDGRPIPIKNPARIKRQQQRDNNLAKKKSTTATTTTSSSSTISSSSAPSSSTSSSTKSYADVFLSSGAIHRIRQICKEMGVDVVNAPFEADAQLGWLVKYEVVDFVATEDCDLVVYGSKKVLFKLNYDGWGDYFEEEDLPECFDMDPTDFSFSSFRRICILAGCDYLNNVKGVGIITAAKIINECTADAGTDEIVDQLKAYVRPGNSIPADYAAGIQRAEETFLHQPIYNVKTRRVEYLTPTPPDWIHKDKQFLGNWLLDEDICLDIALGNLDPSTLRTFKYDSGFYDVDDFPPTSIWSPDYVKGEPGDFPHPTDLIESTRPTPTPQNPWTCPCGDEQFTNIRDFKKHMKSHRLHHCQYADCPWKFKSLSDLIRHVRTHTGEQPYECGDCGKFFSRHSTLTKHRRSHTGERPFKCDVVDCTQDFRWYENLMRHKQGHAGIKPYVCYFCKKRFLQSANLTSHMKLHIKERSLVCGVCKQRFKWRASLVAHGVAIHNKNKPFTCYFCPKKFIQHNALTNHMRLHTQERPFKCKEEGCRKSFKRHDQLQDHIFKKHTDGIPFKCDRCDHGTTTKRALVQHKKTCKGRDVVFKCEKCGKTFGKNNTLCSHKRTCKGGLKCVKCGVLCSGNQHKNRHEKICKVIPFHILYDDVVDGLKNLSIII